VVIRPAVEHLRVQIRGGVVDEAVEEIMDQFLADPLRTEQ